MTKRLSIFLVWLVAVFGVVAMPVNGFAATTAEASSVVAVNPGNFSQFDTDPVNIQLTAFGGTRPYRWSATGLDGSGMSLDSSTGIIWASLPHPGGYTVTATVTAASGGSSSTTFHIRIVRECRTCLAR